MTPPEAFVTIAAASQLSGVPVRTLHRWVARGQLHAMAGQQGRLVDLEEVRRLARMAGHPAATAESLAGQSATGRPPAQDDVPWPAMAELIAVNDRLSCENVELAGRCGFLQARVQDLERENRLLRAPVFAAHIPEESHQSAAEPNEPVRGANQSPRRRWWDVWSWLRVG